MKNFVVRNTQTFRTVTLYGRVLASAHVGGRTNRMFLTKAELLGPPCVDKLRTGVLALVQGNPPEELAALLKGHEVMDVPAVPVSAPAADVEPPLTSMESVEPLKVPEAPKLSESSPPNPSHPVVSETSDRLPTKEDLNHFTVKELKARSEELGIEVSGSKPEIIAQILKFYGVSNAS